jgi:hypothetical protein
MSRTLTISDELFARLEAEAHNQGLNTVEELLDRMQIHEDRLARRDDVVREIDRLREQLLARYGQMPDSVDLVREDRAR